MDVKKVEIMPGCVSCGTCEFICPAVFEVKGIAKVKNIDLTPHTEAIKEAAFTCPVNVIKINE